MIGQRVLAARRSAPALLTAVVLSAIASTAAAQSQPIPPEHYTLDPRGVDLVAGTFNFGGTEVAIGPAAGGLSYGRIYSNQGWRDTNIGSMNGAGNEITVNIGPISEVFVYAGGFDYVSKYGNGSTLTVSPGQNTVLGRDGSVAIFDTAVYTNFYDAGSGLISQYSMPDGTIVTYHWKSVSGVIHHVGYDGTRLQSVTNNRGYMIKYEYWSDAVPTTADWFSVKAVTGINMAVDWCDPDGDSCPSLTRTWPSVTYDHVTDNKPLTATDQSSRMTTYGYSSGFLASIQLPESSGPDISVIYAGSSPYNVTDVTDASGHWTYGFSTAGTTQTTSVSGPLGQGLTVLSDTTTGRATSVTDALSNTWSYQYDSDLRLTRVTQPEGDHADYSYDGRGNLISTTWTDKTGLSTITTGASYPSACTDPGVTPETCNKPLTTTDGVGAVTDYAWDATTGQPLSVTAPAPTVSADRPQTRYIYAAEQARYHDSASTFVNGPAISLPTAVSACATGEWDPLAVPATCDTGAGEEVLTTVAYPTTASANNLLPLSVTRGSGATPNMATTATTYTANGDVHEVDGPLSGSTDKVEYFYDDARQMTGMVGPDPDGGGALLNRARRITYNDNGQVVLAETGTTTGYVDPSVSGFTPLVRSQTTYDPAAFNRPVESRQLDGSTGVAGVQQVEYDAAGRVSCTAVRMNPATWASLPAACTAATTGGFGPDRIVQTAYDALGRPVSATSGLGTVDALTVGTTYTDNGRVESLTDGNGHVSITEYDGFDRPVKLRYPNAASSGTSTTDFESWTYDDDGRPLTHRGRDAQTTSLTWDLLGHNTAVMSPSGTLSTAATFDNLGRRTSITGNAMTVSTTWDALSHMITESVPGIGDMTYGWDAGERMTGIIWPDGFAATYDHDLYGATTEIKQVPSGGSPSSLATYAYDNLGMLTAIARNGGSGAATAYGYDAFGRLSSLTHNLSGGANDLTLGYSYNPASQIVGRTVSNDAYVYTPARTQIASNNNLNQITAINASPVTYDANQNATGVPGHAYGYDAQGRLTSASAGLGAAVFVFDPLGRLHDSTVGGAQMVYSYAGAQLAAEYNNSGTLLHRHVPGLGLDDVVTSYVGSGTGTRSWQLADERGSVVALADGSGVATQINAYDEYGVSAPGNSGRFQYAGQPWIAEAGAYSYRTRAYLPELGRFLQTDPAKFASGQNMYAYVGLEPINREDPFGLAWENINWTDCTKSHVSTLPDIYRCVDKSVTFWTDNNTISDRPGLLDINMQANPDYTYRPSRLSAQRCPTLQRLLRYRADVRAAADESYRRMLKTGYEEGFWVSIVRHPGARTQTDIVQVYGHDFEYINAIPPPGDYEIQIFYHWHTGNSGMDGNDYWNARGGGQSHQMFPVVAMTPSGGVYYECPSIGE